MKLTTLLVTLLTTFATEAPNLCDDVYLDAAGEPYSDIAGRMLPRYCAWTGPDVPVWDADVCCTIDGDGADCSAAEANGRCQTGMRMYCEYGEELPDGRVDCYQPFPSMCDAGLCLDAPEAPPPTQAIFVACCGPGGACQGVTLDNIFDCEGDLLACPYGFQNGDGTVECYWPY